MMYVEGSRIIEEIESISIYLDFSHKNLIELKKQLAGELSESIKKIRQTDFVDSTVTDEELIQRVLFLDTDDDFFRTEEGRPFIKIIGNFYRTEHQEEFEGMLYVTIVTMLYSCVERGLVKLCNIKQENGKCINILSQAQDFFNGSTDYKMDNSLWQEIDSLRRLRNILMHFGASLPVDDSFDEEVVVDNYGDMAFLETYTTNHLTTDKKFIEYLKSRKIYTKQFGSISLSLEYCQLIIEKAHRFFAGFLFVHESE